METEQSTSFTQSVYLHGKLALPRGGAFRLARGLALISSSSQPNENCAKLSGCIPWGALLLMHL